MVLVLVLHTLEDVTATVPMCVILINDLAKRKQIPESFRLRQARFGEFCPNVWDITDMVYFSEWLGQNLGPGVTHTVLEIVEQFSIGLMGQVRQSRAGDRAKTQFAAFSTTTKTAVSRAGEQLADFDRKYEISERTTHTFKKVSDAASQAKERAMENPTINRVSTNVNAGVQAGLKTMGVGIDWARTRLSSTLVGNASAPTVEAPPVPQAPPPPVASTPTAPSASTQPPQTRQGAAEERKPVFDLADVDD